MNQALYAHMKNKRKKITKKTNVQKKKKKQRQNERLSTA
jgi:hypothetical protein